MNRDFLRMTSYGGLVLALVGASAIGVATPQTSEMPPSFFVALGLAALFSLLVFLTTDHDASSRNL